VLHADAYRAPNELWRLANVVYVDASTYTSRQLSSVVSFSEVTQLLNESM